MLAAMAGGLLAFGCSSGGAPSAHAGSGGTSSTSSPSTSAVAPTTGAPHAISEYQLPAALGATKPYWLVEKFSVPALLRAGLSPALLEKFFDNPQTFVIVRPSDPGKDPTLPDATYVMSFADFRKLQTAISSGSIPPYVKLLLYDNERWAATPAAQQQQPFAYEAEAEAVAHAHGLGFIFTPAANLSMVLSPAYSNATKFDGYTSLGIAAQAAPHTDVLEIQAQQDEADSGFDALVSSAVTQAQAVDPHPLVMVGLTTVAPHQVITPQVLLNDYNATRPLVSGYWLNVPGGPGGPRDPDVAVAFLQALAVQLGS
jgi:hypothetical protein